MANQQLSNNGLRLIQGFEGFHRSIDGGKSAQAYRDAVGVLTIGWGHTRTVKSEDMIISRDQAEDLLRKDVAGAEAAVNKAVKVPINQNQFDALVSFVFNLGEGNFRKSSLLRKLNDGQYSEVPSEFLRWVNAGGKPLPGLVRRRKAEAALFEADESEMVEVTETGDVMIRMSYAPSPEVSTARRVETANQEKPLAKSRTMQAGTAATVVAGGGAALETLDSLTTGVSDVAGSASDSLAQVSESLESLNELADGTLDTVIQQVNEAQSAIQQAESTIDTATQTAETVQGLPAKIANLFSNFKQFLVDLGLKPEWIDIGIWVILALLALRIIQARMDDRAKGRR